MIQFTSQELEMMQEIANYAKLKNINIKTKEGMDKAFNGWITSNLSYNYFNNEDFNKNFTRQIKKQLS